MSHWTVVLIIAVVIGVIASNIALLRHSAKFTFPTEKRTKLGQTPSQAKGDTSTGDHHD